MELLVQLKKWMVKRKSNNKLYLQNFYNIILCKQNQNASYIVFITNK